MFEIIQFIFWIGFIYFVYRQISKAGKKKKTSQKWLDSLPGVKYKIGAEGTGMAVDPVAKKVFLLSGDEQQDYPFDAIRKWRYSLGSGGMTHLYGNVGVIGGLTALGQNVSQAKENKRSSGFFIEVKDIDRPEWQVFFPGMDGGKLEKGDARAVVEKEMKRWLEIFQQIVNEGRPV